MSKYLILDTNFLCYRAFFAMKNLQHKNTGTAVTYGVMREVIQQCDKWGTRNVLFTFDSTRSIRQGMYRPYKSQRKQLAATEKEKNDRKELYLQMRALRRKHLPELGFRNVFSQYGYEADDVIASLCNTLSKEKHEAVLISADKDLYQLLSSSVSMYNPNQKALITAEIFATKYGISPSQWGDVKAIAGCSTDNIQGVKGVGEKTAILYLTGKLPTSRKSHESIVRGNKIWERNLKIVKLPLAGTRVFKIRKDKVTNKKWDALAAKLDMETLKRKRPKMRQRE